MYIFPKKTPVTTFNHHRGDPQIDVTLLWEPPTEEELHKGIKEMTWVKDKNSKFSIDPQSPSIHPQLAQFSLQPKSVVLPLVVAKDEDPVAYRHYESGSFDVVQVSKVPKDDYQ